MWHTILNSTVLSSLIWALLVYLVFIAVKLPIRQLLDKIVKKSTRLKISNVFDVELGTDFRIKNYSFDAEGKAFNSPVVNHEEQVIFNQLKEKYGEAYNLDATQTLIYQLANKNIICQNLILTIFLYRSQFDLLDYTMKKDSCRLDDLKQFYDQWTLFNSSSKYQINDFIQFLIDQNLLCSKNSEYQISIKGEELCCFVLKNGLYSALADSKFPAP